MNETLVFAPEVREALAAGGPVVALESTLITHGFPYPANVETALAMERVIRQEGGVPATIAVLDGQITVGLSAEQIERLAALGQAGVRKCSRRDLPIVVGLQQHGATTVAGTMIVAHMAGIEVFATGGIGGVHRGHPEDVSADLIELGIPFSDPLADGPTIQQASQIALAQGMSVPTALEMTRQLRQQGVQQPCLFMSYLNPLLAYGLEAFIRDASRAGIDGLIIPDLPLEESIPVRRLCQAHDLALIPLIPPNLSMGRIAQIVQDATGFLYLVSVTGVTGVRDSLPPDLGSFLRRVRQITPLPLAVGFGIASPEQVQALYPLADGVIVGSALIRAVASSNQPLEAAANFLRALVHAANEVKSA
jgi:tryptophan synthase alpha chain